jgi:quercetin dioxygenase-like cupin family protein
MRLAIVMVAWGMLAWAEDPAVVRKFSENKLAPLPMLPSCVSTAVESGDPFKGRFVLVFKGTAGCTIPWHWHTVTENVMVISGSAKLEMKDDNGHSAVLGPGGYAMMPGKHVHQFTCATACSAFVSADGAFDIHYVDAKGDEIPIDAALKKK